MKNTFIKEFDFQFDGRRERRLFPAARIFDFKHEEGARKIAGAR